MLRNICDFSRAEADFRAIQRLKAGHKAAEKEIAHVGRAKGAMAAATAAR